VARLLDKRLVFVTGKGGVGRSTVAMALGLVAARRGKRTIIAEVAGQERVSRVFSGEQPEHGREIEVADGLWAISIDPEHAIREYLQIQVRVKAVAELLSHSRMFQYFAAATPGMAELVTMGKVWELAQPERKVKRADRYDVVIVDAPATGHGVAIMRAPKTFADVARVGPIAHQGNRIHATITDRAITGVVAVALPEEMPVNETGLLQSQLRSALGLDIDLLVANGVYPQRFDAADAVRLAAELGEPGGLADGPARSALRAALAAHGRAASHREQIERLVALTGREAVELPFLFESEFGLSAYERLSVTLDGAL
jgi:anion-transporting  ArsA/GET3 family ATPase